MSGKIQIVSKTDKGLKREHNEDSIGKSAEHGVVVLADGMGGYNAGEVASEIAVQTLIKSLTKIRVKHAIKQKPSQTPTQTDEIDQIKHDCLLALNKCNQIIYQKASSQPQYKGMGTTIATSIFYDNKIIYSHIGDSRIYCYRDDTLQQLTSDHTLLQELVDRGLYSREEARTSPNKNLITKALGTEPEVEPSIDQTDTHVGDIYLFCSDGLNDMISDTQIGLILSEHPLNKHADNLKNAADALVDKANQNGGSDNISVILVRIVKPYPSKVAWHQKLINWL